MSNKGILACHGYSFEEFPDAIDIHPFIDRANSSEIGIIYSLYGRPAIDLVFAKICQYQIPKFELNYFELEIIFTCNLIIQYQSENC